ncbi:MULTISPECIES: MaoC family dehydratase [Vibrio]|uniref:MaoC family dehydratase n=1 Tax=Vibrio qingdaonensis TaxID=2829491 RepID=A0A9X3CNS7_9VIBR|nr:MULTISPECIES: MaoC family dehydratase [Vibrio]MCL9775623.1 MaoC family dehydratase [Vibrio methylphosphonaticus]MCW8346797.1 MaoC family dehydratase [Vibrio qingdaonensis]
MSLEVGQHTSLTKTLDKAAVEAFASLAEDYNPVHLDEAFAAMTPFEVPIVHGMLASSLVSGLLASKLPGPGAIYLGQTLKFTCPIRVGETVTARVEVKHIREDKPIVTLLTEVLTEEGQVAIQGEATVMLPN